MSLNIKYQDIYFKQVLDVAANILFELFKIDGTPYRILNKEIIDYYGNSGTVDFAVLTKEEKIDIIENMSTKLTQEDLDRFVDYKNEMRRRYRLPVSLYILSTAKNETLPDGDIKVDLGNDETSILKLKTFRSINGDEILAKIKKMMENDETFDKRWIYILSAIPYMSYERETEDMIKEIAVLTNKIKIDKHDKIIIKMFQSYLIETLIEDEKTQDELSELVNMENTAIGRYIERKEREIEEKWEEKGKVIEQQWKIKENEQQQKWKNKENEQQQKWKNKENEQQQKWKNEQQQKWKIKEAELKENQKKNLFESARQMLLDNIPDNKIVKYLSIQEDDLVKIKLDIAAK